MLAAAIKPHTSRPAVASSFFCNDPAPTEISSYCHTLSLHDALPLSGVRLAAVITTSVIPSRPNPAVWLLPACVRLRKPLGEPPPHRSEEHTSELQSLMRSSYADYCLKKNKRRWSIDHSDPPVGLARDERMKTIGRAHV